MWQQLMPWPAFGGSAGERMDSSGGLVDGAARVSGARAHAWVVIDQAEHRRRATAGLSAVTNLALLDTLLSVPRGEQVSWAALSTDAQHRLRRAPEGIVEYTSGAVRRLFTPAASVNLVVVPAQSWRSGLRRAAAFAPFAPRVILVDVPPEPGLLWEANVLGIGVWQDQGPDQPEVLLPPAPWRYAHTKAAGWRFREYAYGAWLNAIGGPPAPNP